MATVETPVRLYKNTLPNSNTTLFTASSTKVIIKAVTLCNKTALPASATIKFAGVDVINQYPIAPHDTVTIPFMDQIILDTELIEGSADTASAVNCYISGIEVEETV